MASSKARVFDTLEKAGFPAFSVVLARPPIIVYREGVDEAAAGVFMQGYDWSDEAERAWEDARDPRRTDLRQRAAAAVADLEAFLAVDNPTAAQVRIAVQKLAAITRALILRVVEV